MNRLRQWLIRHPLIVDIGVVLLVATIAAPASAADQPSGTDWPWLVAVLIPLIWRRRYPLAVFWTVFAVATISGAVEAQADLVWLCALVAVYSLARYCSRRAMWLAAAALGVVITLGGVADGEPWAGIIATLAVIAAIMLLGAYLQTRRAYLDELVARAERLERERDQQARLAVAAERARIAREMHDIVAHNLAVMVALAEAASYTANRAPERAADAMDKVSETGRQALGEMRRLLSVLRDDATGDPVLAPGPQPGLDDIDELINQVRAAGPDVTISVTGDPGDWGPGAGLAVYRIIQEALTNTLKHAGASAHIGVTLAYSADSATIEIVDDGAGRRVLRPSDGGTGQGIPGMIERAGSYEGTVEAGPRPGAGWRVHAHLKFDAQAPATTAAESATSMEVGGPPATTGRRIRPRDDHAATSG